MPLAPARVLTVQIIPMLALQVFWWGKEGRVMP